MFLTKKSNNLLRRNVSKARINTIPERTKKIEKVEIEVPVEKTTRSRKNNSEKNEEKQYENKE